MNINPVMKPTPHVVVRTNPLTRQPEILRAPAGADFRRANLWATWHRGHTRGARDARAVPATQVRFTNDGDLQLLPA